MGLKRQISASQIMYLFHMILYMKKLLDGRCATGTGKSGFELQPYYCINPGHSRAKLLLYALVSKCVFECNSRRVAKPMSANGPC
jgi:hypothetical protein